MVSYLRHRTMKFSYGVTTFVNCLWCALIWPTAYLHSEVGKAIETNEWMFHQGLCVVSTVLDCWYLLSILRAAFGASFDTPIDYFLLGGIAAYVSRHAVIYWAIWMRRRWFTKTIVLIKTYWSVTTEESKPHKVMVQLTVISAALFTMGMALWCAFVEVIPRGVHKSLANGLKAQVLKGKFHLFMTNNPKIPPEELTGVKLTAANILIGFTGFIIQMFGNIWGFAIDLLVLVIVINLWGPVVHFKKTHTSGIVSRSEDAEETALRESRIASPSPATTTESIEMTPVEAWAPPGEENGRDTNEINEMLQFFKVFSDNFGKLEDLSDMINQLLEIPMVFTALQSFHFTSTASDVIVNGDWMDIVFMTHYLAVWGLTFYFCCDISTTVDNLQYDMVKEQRRTQRFPPERLQQLLDELQIRRIGITVLGNRIGFNFVTTLLSAIFTNLLIVINIIKDGKAMSMMNAIMKSANHSQYNSSISDE